MSDPEFMFKTRPKYVTRWYKLRNGQVKSFRFTVEADSERHAAMLRKGAVEHHDLMRKGAPLGGYSIAQCPRIAQVGIHARVGR